MLVVAPNGRAKGNRGSAARRGSHPGSLAGIKAAVLRRLTIQIPGHCAPKSSARAPCIPVLPNPLGRYFARASTRPTEDFRWDQKTTGFQSPRTLGRAARQEFHRFALAPRRPSESREFAGHSRSNPAAHRAGRARKRAAKLASGVKLSHSRKRARLKNCGGRATAPCILRRPRRCWLASLP